MKTQVATSFEDDRITKLRETIQKTLQHPTMTNGEQWEQAGTIPKEAYQLLGSYGLLGICHPTEYGGTDLGPVGSVVFAEEISRNTYSGLAEAILIHTDMASTHIALCGNNEQKDRFLPGIIKGDCICAIAVTEPDAGSDVATIKTRASKTNNGWKLNGKKTYVTNALHGDLFIVLVRTQDDKPSRSMSLFIVERGTPGLTINPMPKKHGMLSSDIAELVFEDALIPQENLLGEENKGFYSIMENFQNERLVLGAMSLGMAREALAITLEHLKQRKAFGATLWDLQANRHRLAFLAARIEAVGTFVYQTAKQYAGEADCVREISMVKALASETLLDTVRGCLQLHGGAGYMQDCAIERIGRDARVMTIGGGATEVMLDEIARRL